MDRGKLILITGGARSGKSRMAEELASSLSSSSIINKRVIYLATAGAGDEEMQQRILRHQQRRPGHWETIEESYSVEAVIRERGAETGVILLDCLALLLSNWLFEYANNEKLDWSQFNQLSEIQSEQLLNRMSGLAETARDAVGQVIIVSNEVGLGLVPENPLGRIYRDLLGLSNQIMAAKADEVYMVWVGIPQKIKG